MTSEKSTVEQEQPASAELSIQDLMSLKQIVDIASQRGAFRPNEMAQVGQTYNKLEAFLTEVAKQQEASKASAAGNDDSTQKEK